MQENIAHAPNGRAPSPRMPRRAMAW
ncbi:Protein of unknown function, partial [Gryllus bimaculatus]